MFLHYLPSMAYLSDANFELIELFQVVKDHPVKLSRKLEWHQKRHSENHYYRTRAKIPADAIDRAARFLYLNRTCWNGLYRVNLKGEFNVPIGTKSAVVYENENFLRISRKIKHAVFACEDFQAAIDRAERGDYVFADPPYTVKHNSNNFVKYNEDLFSWDDQVRLRDALFRAKDRGVSVVLTNADHPGIKRLYRGFGKYTSVQRYSVLAANSVKRGEISEALFLSNLDYG